ncbi:MAG: chemotaxis protein CheW [Alphaproteobacteria bacterium]|nr:MAG: chemotaxis protein CheW [Alphaproteobacteria bacterium]
MPSSSQHGTEADAADSRQFITFTIDQEEYGVDIMAVREIKGWVPTASIPKAPAHVRGVINLRGIIVPIFDLRARFGQGLTEPTRTHVVIIVMVGPRTIGLLVDSVSDILSTSSADIRPVPEMDRSIDDAFLDGLVATGDRMVTLISLDGLFRSTATSADLLAS